MNERVKKYAYGFLIFRLLIDLGIAAAVYLRTEIFMFGVIYLALCAIFLFFLIYGIIREEFPGRDRLRIYHSHEPVAFWFVVGFLIAAHLAYTIFFVVSV